WILRPYVGEPFLKAIFVKQLPDALASGQLEMVGAFWANVKAALGLLAKNGRLALRAVDPKTLWNSAFSSWIHDLAGFPRYVAHNPVPEACSIGHGTRFHFSASNFTQSASYAPTLPNHARSFSDNYNTRGDQRRQDVLS